MEIPDYDDVADLAAWVKSELPVGDDTAERIARELDSEASHDLGDPAELWASIKDGRGIIADVGVDILSGVDVPAVDSTMLAMKSKTGNVWGGERDILLAKDADEEQRISYAAAMIPREADKEGETVSTPTVEKAAHDYLKTLQHSDGTGVDTDHNLIDDKGFVVESWVLKEDREFQLPDGGTKTHKAGDWIVGIEWVQKAWERVKSGDIEGISIYGTAEQIPVERAAARKDFVVPFADETVVHLIYESRTAAEKASEQMGLGGDVHEHEFDGMAVFMPGDNHEAFVDAYMEMAESEDENVNMDSYGEEKDAEKDEENPCWEGYEMIGTKTDEFGNEVPNCVPKSAAKRLSKIDADAQND
jgi:hypothetical protein